MEWRGYQNQKQENDHVKGHKQKFPQDLFFNIFSAAAAAANPLARRSGRKKKSSVFEKPDKLEKS